MSVALITGGSRGIGRAIVEEFAAAGHHVAFTYVTNQESAGNLAECLRRQNRPVAMFQADSRDFGRAREVVEQTEKELGPITTLVNNAGVKKDRAFHLMDEDTWREVLETNLTGTFNYARAVIGSMIRRGGSVINVTSVSGAVGIAGQANYSASKAGVIGLTKALAREVARFGVRVNAIAPGFIETGMTGSMEAETRKKLYAQIPVRRPGTAREVARLALYLASEDAAYVTGQVWTIDGGLS